MSIASLNCARSDSSAFVENELSREKSDKKQGNTRKKYRYRTDCDSESIIMMTVLTSLKTKTVDHETLTVESVQTTLVGKHYF